MQTLEALFVLEAAPSPDYPALSQSINPAETTNQTEIAGADNVDDDHEALGASRKGKLRSHLSVAGLTLAGMRAVEKAGTITARLHSARQAREEQYAVDEKDTKFIRARKFLGRNAIRIAAASIVSLTAGVITGLKIKSGIDLATGADTVPLDHDPSSIDIFNTASTRYLVGGHVDTDGKGLEGAMNNIQGHGANNTVRIDYPAEIAPFPGDTNTLDQSSQIASDKLYNAWKASGGDKPIEMIGYSQGTQGVQDAANRIAAENGGVLPNNVNVLLIATPNGESGFFNSPYAQAASPILDGLGIDVNKPIPKGAQVIAMDTDFWANSGDKPATTMISQLIGLAGDGHNPPTTDMRSETTVVDGVTYTTYFHKDGPRTAALRVLDQQTDIPVTEGMDRLGQAIAPQGVMGTETHIEAAPVIDAVAYSAKEGLNDRGITQFDPMIDQIAAAAPVEQVQQIFDAAQDLPDQILTPLANAPSGGNGLSSAGLPGNYEQVVTDLNAQVDAYQSVAPPELNNAIDSLQNNLTGILGGPRK